MYNACLVAFQIRDVPPQVREVITAQAKAKGQSLQAYLLDLVETDARRARNVEILRQFGGRTDGVQEEDEGAVLDALHAARGDLDARHGLGDRMNE